MSTARNTLVDELFGTRLLVPFSKGYSTLRYLYFLILGLLACLISLSLAIRKKKQFENQIRTQNTWHTDGVMTPTSLSP